MGGKQVDSSSPGINKEVTWTQTSWLEDSTTENFQEIGASGYVTSSSSTGFRGLAKSTHSYCVIDGDGGTHGNWYNCVGVIGSWGGGTMPGPLGKKASSMYLYIWNSTGSANITVSSSNSSEGTVSPSTLTFTQNNWNTAQTVTVTGVNDNNLDGHQDYDIGLSAADQDVDNPEVTTFAGSGSAGSTNATGTSASFNGPAAITTDGTSLYVADRSNHRIRKIVISTGVVTTLAGSSSGSTDATGTSASFNGPEGITTDGTNLYVADRSNHRIRKIE